MGKLTQKEQQQSIEAFQSVIRKSENAFASMKSGSAQTKLLEKRLKAARIGESLLTARREGKELDVNQEELLEAKQILDGLLLMLPRFLEKTKPGSGQRTYI
ncbi:hypothetical protein JI667_06930 [Bacillus sp. NTK074B]|uniref:hypothetical protein n=1 Tax=Bacillus sp. NTK074B TaxID=2802174 RepID=UPI001A8CB7F2|nr:hypothetical protein [Bacillus sp. NTK074B]